MNVEETWLTVSELILNRSLARIARLSSTPQCFSSFLIRDGFPREIARVTRRRDSVSLNQNVMRIIYIVSDGALVLHID